MINRQCPPVGQGIIETTAILAFHGLHSLTAQSMYSVLWEIWIYTWVQEEKI